MEPITMFAATVGFIGIVHLLAQAAEGLGYGRFNRKPVQGTRKDWYCFFQPADLLGEQTENTAAGKPALSEMERIEERRRQQANRPRLQA